MTTHPRDVVAVAHQTLAFDEFALKQVAVLFNRIAYPGLSALRSLPSTHSQFAQHLIPLAESGIVFEPDIQKSDDQSFKSQLFQDIDELYKPYGVSAEDLLAARQDENKAIEIKKKTRDVTPESLSALADPLVMFRAIQRMTVNMTRLCAIQLRKFNNLDAHAVLPSEFSSFEQTDEAANKHDVLKIVVTALPVPHDDVTWEQIIDYRNDLNSLNRFLDLRSWIIATASGRLTPLEVEERLQPVLRRFRKQMEIHRMKTATTTFEAFVTTTPDVLENLFHYGGSTNPKGLCSLERRKLALLEDESRSEVSEVAFVLGTTFLFDNAKAMDT